MARKLAASFVVSSGDTAEVLQFGEEALDQIALAIERLAEAGSISTPKAPNHWVQRTVR